jgi:hypothetical protein
MKLCATDFTATYRVSRPFRLPDHSGSLLRGVLGRALRKVSCPAAAPCEAACAEPSACAYARLFHPPAPEPPPRRFLRGVTRAPQPLVPLFPGAGGRELAPGDELSLGVRLLGRLKDGDTDRILAALEGVAAFELGTGAGLVAFEAATLRGARDRPIGLDVAPVAAPARMRREIVFETPAALEQKGSLVVDLDFPAFFRAAYRRLTTLCALHGLLEDTDEEAFAELDRLAPSVTTTARRLRPLRWERHSRERDERHPMQGIVGSIVFEGPLASFSPMLRMAEATHIGKATSYGLGRIRVI